MITAMTLWVIGWVFTYGAYRHITATNAKDTLKEQCGPPNFIGLLFLWPLVLGALWVETT